jgi:hypothetical protein
MKLVRIDREGGISAGVTTTPVLYRRLSSFAFTRGPVAVCVCPINATSVSKVTRVRPRQFSVR